MMLKIPIMVHLIHKTLIEVFCRVFYTLYSGSAEVLNQYELQQKLRVILILNIKLKMWLYL